MLSDNISRVIHNIALLLYYNTLKTSSKVGEWLREHKESYKQSLRYVDEPRYIKRDYEDPYEKIYSSMSYSHLHFVRDIYTTQPI